MKTLADIRKSKGYTQRFMATNLNIAIPTYCQYERGGRNVPKRVADKISILLGVAVEEIFSPIRFTILTDMKTLADIRKSKGYTQRSMATNLNINTSTYWQYERGDLDVPKRVADKISILSGVAVEEIFSPTCFTISK